MAISLRERFPEIGVFPRIQSTVCVWGRAGKLAARLCQSVSQHIEDHPHPNKIGSHGTTVVFWYGRVCH